MLTGLKYELIIFLIALTILGGCGGASRRGSDALPVSSAVPAIPTLAPELTPTAAGIAPATPSSQASPQPAATDEAKATPGSILNLVDETEPAITFNISGGIVGFCDELMISADGAYEYLTCNENIGTSTGALEEADLLSLQVWQENLSAFSQFLEDNPGGADNLSTELTFNGQGDVEADENQRRVIFDWVNGLTVRLRFPPEAIASSPEPAAGGAEALCPSINRPALLTVNQINPDNLVVIDPDGQTSCDLVLAHPPFGRIATAGGNIYYSVFDAEAQQATVWQLDASGGQSPLGFTAVPMAEPAPFDFILSDSGAKIAWLRTIIDFEADPLIYKNDLRIASIDGSNLITVMDQSENNEQRFVAPVRFSSDDSTFFYAMQPDIGGPVFTGRYDTLYSIAVGGAEAQLLYACPADDNPVCIGGLSPDGRVLTIVEVQNSAIQVLNLEGGVINSLALPATDYVERTTFGPNGNMAFITAKLLQAEQGGPTLPNPGYISYVAPPYTDQPQTLLADNRVGTLRGWLDDSHLIFDAIDQEGNTTTTLIATDGQMTELSLNVAVGVLR